MKVLWITNQVLPIVAKALNLQVNIFEGWNIFPAKLLSEADGVEFAVASPASITTNYYKKVNLKGSIAYCIPRKFINDKKKMLNIWSSIEADFCPEVVHIQGTEMPHGMFYVDACGNKNVVASIQGMTSIYERYYYGGIDFTDILRNVSLYDIYSSNSIFAGRKRFQISGRNEIRNISRLQHVIGRTTWDMVHCKAINPNVKYHFCNETLRIGFYDAQKWDFKKCIPHSIFLSQCKYPIKALHMMLKAMPLILRYYPDAKIYIGSCIRIIPKNFLQKIAPTNYGGYLLKIIKKLDLEDKIVFLGSLDESQMIAMYQRANVFVSPSSIENSPNSLCEAQILGVPSISSMVGGVEDLTRNGTTTFCYRFEEYEMLAYYICKIFSGDYNYERFLQAMDDARNRHDPQLNFQQLLSIYNKIRI